MLTTSRTAAAVVLAALSFTIAPHARAGRIDVEFWKRLAQAALGVNPGLDASGGGLDVFVSLPIPEPATGVLLALGLAGLLSLRRRA